MAWWRLSLVLFSMSVHVANGPDAVPGFICRSASSVMVSSSFRYWFVGGGQLVWPCARVPGGGCRRFGKSSV